MPDRPTFELRPPMSQLSPTAHGILDAARRLLVSWGNRASHSPDVERPEATKLIEACEKASDVFQCITCNQPLWMANAENKEWVQCQCGELRWRYGKG
jgi:hypothetical protein